MCVNGLISGLLLLTCYVFGSPVELSRIIRHQADVEVQSQLNLLDGDDVGSAMESSNIKGVLSRITRHQPAAALDGDDHGSGMESTETKAVIDRIIRHPPDEHVQFNSLGEDALGSAMEGSAMEGSAMEGSAETKEMLSRITRRRRRQPDEHVQFNSLGEDALGSAMEGSAMEGSAMEGSAMEGSAMEGSAMEGSAMEGSAMEGSAMEGSAMEGSAMEGSAETKEMLSRITRRRRQPDEHVQLNALVAEDDQGSGMESSGTTDVLSGIRDSDQMCIMQVLLCWLEIREQEWRDLKKPKHSPGLADTKVYVECIVKNPLCELGALLQNKHFSSKFNSFVRARSSNVPAA